MLKIAVTLRRRIEQCDYHAFCAFLLLPPMLVARQPEKPDIERKQNTLPSRLTASEARDRYSSWFDFSKRICMAYPYHGSLTVSIMERRDEVMTAIHEAMETYGFEPLPENPRVPSENRYVRPDDVHNCYFMWYGVGSNDLMFVRHSRIFMTITISMRMPSSVWSLDEFHQLLRSRFSANGLSRSVRVETTRRLRFEPKFYEEYKRSNGPWHYDEYDEEGNLVCSWHVDSPCSHGN